MGELLYYIKKNRLAYLSLYILGILYFLAIFADFIAPYPYDIQHRDTPYHPPTQIHFFDKEGNFHLRPFVYGYDLVDPVFKKYRINYEKKYHIRFFVDGEKHYLLGFIPTKKHLFGVEEGGKIFLLGADHLGRDIFSRLLYGGRVSLSIGLVGVLLSFTIGAVVGGISGYFGGRIDNILMRISEIVMSFPGFYLMLALRAVFPITLSSVQVYFLIVVILSFIGWAGLARVIRGMVLSIREQEFVLAAKSYGASSLRIILRHIIPNTFSYLLIAATLSIPGYILGESALSLLGLGIQEPYASWGNMLSSARSISAISSYPWILAPGIAIFITILAFNLLGDALRDALDPKLRKNL
ncbi:MAG TPA: ABC transporter permease [Persephonella sp.]|uniref:Oligopeptide transport system permease protein AppC n=1 Tax=Persephonella marina (strain DSM 14350 / EX-H1) TaxID=123214 RepID=C0QQ78_PERMH|nr:MULTISPECIES: ABC transporter permease [Persephonella]ACO02991.1 oligopeptide transport system permease protein AppC [Persephonella marina EX-H1]HCB69569.1 ABC transporter permease [Persephonella sp.]